MIETEGIRYSGSKKKIIPYIIDIVDRLPIKNALDGFSGTTQVAQCFKQLGLITSSNDMSEYSRVFGECYLLSKIDHKIIQEKINYLNSLNGVDGWFSYNYGGEDNNGSSIQKDGKKRIWQIHNTRKLDAIRDEIDKISESRIEKSVLITSLILALDKVDNTLGHQVAFLSKWAPRSYCNLELKIPNYKIDDKEHCVIKNDIFDIKETFDLVYLDPPYGTSNTKTLTTRVRYFSYYNIWTTVCLNDRPKLVGKSGRREEFGSDSNDGAVSVFENTKLEVVIDAFCRMFSALKSRFFLVSYNNKSKVPIDILEDVIKKSGKIIDIKKIQHAENIQKKLTTSKEWQNKDKDKDNFEYLFLFEK